VKKLQDLKAIGDPVQRRFYEAEHREAAVTGLKSSINQASNWAQTNKEEKYSHIPDEDRQKLLNEANSTDQWLINQLIQQDRQAKTANPVITVQQIQQKKDSLDKLANQIISKPKPAPPKPAEQPKPAPNAADGNAKPDQQPQTPTANEPQKPSDGKTNESAGKTEPKMDTSS